MRVIIQRVSQASITINQKIKREINRGLVVLVGFETEDSKEDIDWIVQKVIQLRIFGDQNDKMNLSIADIKGDLLVVSQFTLFASTKKGNRPSFIRAAPASVSIPLYDSFVKTLRHSFTGNLQTGEFGTNMQINLTNEGPVTISIDSKQRQ